MAAHNTDIAIVGLGLHFPGAANSQEYWQRLKEAKDLSEQPGPDRWPIDAERHLSKVPQADTLRCLRGYYLHNLPSPEEEGLPQGTDPVFTLSLSTARQALEDCSNINKKRTGVVMAAIALPTDTTSTLSEEVLGHDFEQRLRSKLTSVFPEKIATLDLLADNKQAVQADIKTTAANTAPVGLPAQLIAHQFGLGLGGYTLDAACASSLVAVALACDELRAHRADAMLAGGLSRPDCLYTQMGFSALRALSPSGVCSPFDAKADGLMVGEGCGLVILKRLEDAIAQGDKIYGVIKSVGLSNDIEGSLVAPSSEGQLRSLRQAYEICGLQPWDIDLIECHGTGTPVGDKVEFNSLQALWQDAPQDSLCQLRSVKSMIGHLLTAAGSAGLIRVLLNMQNGLITPQVNFATPGLPLTESHFRVDNKEVIWTKQPNRPRRAAVSGFGFGGINAHLILEEYEAPALAPTESNSLNNSAPTNYDKQAAESVAVVGLACHFGSLDNTDKFRNAIFSGLSALTDLPENRWQGLGESKATESNAKQAYIDKVSVPLGKFRIPPTDIPNILPQQSLLLNVASQAMADAGQPLRERRNEAAAFIGIALDLNSTNFNLRWQLEKKAQQLAKALNLTAEEAEAWLKELKDEISKPLDSTRTMGALGSIAASRVAREFQFGGCSFTVSAQEVSGFTALKLGVQALQKGDLNLTLVGAVDLQGDVRQAHFHFDDKLDGYGEGACCLVLKRFSDAQRDGDHIYCLIKGFGQTEAGQIDSEEQQTAQTALEQACHQAKIKPERLGYLECGNDNLLTDPTKAKTLEKLCRNIAQGEAPLSVGSVSNVVGKCGAASALASLAKVALSLDRHILPAYPEFIKPATEFSNSNNRLCVHKKTSFWFNNRAEGPRCAAIINTAHPQHICALILEEAPAADYKSKNEAIEQAKSVIFASLAAKPQELKEKLQKLQQEAEAIRKSELSTAEALLKLSASWWQRQDTKQKLAMAFVIDLTTEEPWNEFQIRLKLAIKHLEDYADKALANHSIFYTPEPLAEHGKIAFVYPGSGANFLGLGRELALQFPAIMDRFDSENLYMADEFMARWNQPYRLNWEEGWQHEALTSLASDTHKMMFSQVTFAMLSTDIIRYLGIEPQAAIGYSLGESAALFALRAWPERDLMYKRMENSDLFREQLSGPCLAARRAWNIPSGAPFEWTVGLIRVAAAQVKEAMKDIPKVRLLIVNTDNECVIGGTREAVSTLCTKLKTKAILVSGVDTVHCDCLDPVAQAYWEMHHLPCTPPKNVDFYSGYYHCSYNLTSEKIADSIVAHGRFGFDYTKTIRQAWQDGVRIFLEMGPGAACSRMINSILADKPHFAISLSNRGKAELASLECLLAGAISQGLRPDLNRLFPTELLRKSNNGKFQNIDICLGRTPFDPPLPKLNKTNLPHIGERQDLPFQKPVIPIEERRAVKMSTPQHTNQPPVFAAASQVVSTSPAPMQQLEQILVEVSESSQQNHSKWLNFVKDSSQAIAALMNRQSILIQQLSTIPGTALSEEIRLPDRIQAVQHLPVCAQANDTVPAVSTPKVQSLAQATRLLSPDDGGAHAYTTKLHGVEFTTSDGYVCGGKPSLAPADQKVFLDRDECLEFAIGKIGKVLGEKFAPIDDYSTRVRLPAEPLMLVDRIISVEGEPLSLGSGRVVTEHDVVPGMWYLDGNRAPVFISVEAGQADLFLCSWLGIDFKAQGKRVYRLLDANVTFHRGLPQPGETIHYDIRIKRFINQGDTWLFFFEYEGTINGQIFLTMRDGCAGFFTPQEIRNNGGLVLTEENLRPKQGKKDPQIKDLVPLSTDSYSFEQVEALRRGDLEACFGQEFAGLALDNPVSLPSSDLLRLIHRIPECDPFGGRWGLGKVIAEADVHPEDWYLTCHFVDDMVMPGTLMYECCAHALRFLLARLGWVGEKDRIAYEPVVGVKAVLKCRGPVLQTTKTVRYQVEIKEIGYNPQPYVIADAIMYADNKRVVGFENVSMQLTGTTGCELEELWHSRKPGIKIESNIPSSSKHLGDPIKSAIFSEEQFMQFAVGRPSLAFGPEFAKFDSRFIARLPGPPYQFVSRIVSADHPFLKTIPGGWVEAQYDVPADAWYFKAGHTGNMPFCILNEIALQVCGWVSSYAGSSMHSEENLHYRNLGGSSRLYEEITPKTGTVTIKVRMTKSSEAGGLIIQDFDMWLGQQGRTIYEGKTTFGFFTEKSLADQVGVRGADKRIWYPRHEEPWEVLPKLAPLAPNDNRNEHNCSLEMPGKALLMLDEYAWYPQGGKRGLGAIIGKKQIDPQEWFFKAHFFQDPVMPGSLGLEAFIQALKAAALKLWPNLKNSHHFSAILPNSTHQWLYRGQVAQTNQETTVRAEIKEIGQGSNPYIKADGFLQADGKVIYELKDFGLALLTD